MTASELEQERAAVASGCYARMLWYWNQWANRWNRREFRRMFGDAVPVMAGD